jgi:hypothetical protein
LDNCWDPGCFMVVEPLLRLGRAHQNTVACGTGCGFHHDDSGQEAGWRIGETSCAAVASDHLFLPPTRVTWDVRAASPMMTTRPLPNSIAAPSADPAARRQSHTGLRLVAAPHSPPAKRAPFADRITCGEPAPRHGSHVYRLPVGTAPARS